MIGVDTGTGIYKFSNACMHSERRFEDFRVASTYGHVDYVYTLNSLMGGGLGV